MRYSVLAAALMFSYAASAQSLPDVAGSTVDVPPPLPLVSSLPTTTDFIVSGWTLPTEWHFSAGPLKQPEKTVLRLTRRVPGGGIGLQCNKSDGSMDLSFVIDNYIPAEGKVLYLLRIGRNSGPVELQANKPSADEPDIILSVKNPVAITDILYSMSSSATGELLTLETPDKKSFNTTTPGDIQISAISASVCDEWHKAVSGLGIKP